jgi:hypothetical protein
VSEGGGRWREAKDGGRRKEEGGRKKEEGGRRKEEGGRRGSNTFKLLAGVSFHQGNENCQKFGEAHCFFFISVFGLSTGQ